jgi:flagella basal body P-ring formation protein FlgA
MKQGMVLGLLLVAVASSAQAANLRNVTTLEHAMVRVSDLFDDAGPASSRVLGPGPAPGGRLVVEAAQLSAIARQFGVDWRSSSPADRVVLDRPGQPITREDVLGVLRPALASAGAAPGIDVDLPGYEAPIVSPDSQPRLVIEQIDLDQTGGRFSAVLAITTNDMPLQRMRLAGRVQEMTEIAVPVQRLPAGHVIARGDLQMTRVRVGAFRGDVVREPGQALGQALRRQIQPGQAVAMSDIGAPVVIQKGARVMMRLESAGLQVSAAGIATEQGSIGQHISVMNPSSRALVDAVILGPDLVRVSPDSPPRLASAASTSFTSRQANLR